MENWGLIIGSPPNLLLDPVRGDLSSKVHITSIQSHEIARQWYAIILLILRSVDLFVMR